jgi:hypothetical protein
MTHTILNTSGTVWTMDLVRPVVHERRVDGAHIIHIRPRGGKSTLVNKIMVDLISRNNTRVEGSN